MIKSISDKDACDWLVCDLDGCSAISGVQHANDETGEYIQAVRNSSGRCQYDEAGELIVRHRIGNIRLIKRLHH